MRRTHLLWGVAMVAAAALLCLAGITEFALPPVTIHLPGFVALAGVVQIVRAFPPVTAGP